MQRVLGCCSSCCCLHRTSSNRRTCTHSHTDPTAAAAAAASASSSSSSGERSPCCVAGVFRNLQELSVVAHCASSVPRGMFLTAGLPHAGALQRLHVSTPGKLCLCYSLLRSLSFVVAHFSLFLLFCCFICS
jgi:hypothetical protein